MSEPVLRADVEVHVKHGMELRVFSAARTVADCFTRATILRVS